MTTVRERKDFVGFFTDVTERSRVEQELRESEAQFKAMFEPMPRCAAVHREIGPWIALTAPAYLLSRNPEKAISYHFLSLPITPGFVVYILSAGYRISSPTRNDQPVKGDHMRRVMAVVLFVVLAMACSALCRGNIRCRKEARPAHRGRQYRRSGVFDAGQPGQLDRARCGHRARHCNRGPGRSHQGQVRTVDLPAALHGTPVRRGGRPVQADDDHPDPRHLARVRIRTPSNSMTGRPSWCPRT